MKTPRQILFQRHRSAEAKLDEIRAQVVGDDIRSLISAKPNLEDSSRRFLQVGWAELLREALKSLRWHLAGMSAVWLFAIFLNIDQSSTSAITGTKKNAPSPQQLVMALRENRRQIAELTASPANVSEPIPAPHSFIWPRRNEFPSINEMA